MVEEEVTLIGIHKLNAELYVYDFSADGQRISASAQTIALAKAVYNSPKLKDLAFNGKLRVPGTVECDFHGAQKFTVDLDQNFPERDLWLCMEVINS